MSDRDFKLQVLTVTLQNASVAGIRDPLEAAQQNLEWCLAPIDKPRAQSFKHQANKSG
jgi:hypothetical protein